MTNLRAKIKVKSPVDNDFFDPHSFVLFHDGYIRRTNDFEVLSSFFRHRENAATVLNASGQSMVADNSTKLHELCHWHQFAGTSLGANLSLVQQIRDSTGLANFINLSSADKKSLIERRNTGHPMIELDDGYKFRCDASLSEQAQLILQIWYDYLLYYQFMLGGLTRGELGDLSFLGSLFGQVNGDVISMMKEDSFDMSDIQAVMAFGVESKQRFALKRISFFGDGPNFNAIDLFEGQAFINEVFFELLKPREKDENQELQALLVRSQEDTTYTRSIKWFFEEIGLSYDLERLTLSIFTTYCAIADIALNPPLPPFVEFTDIDPNDLWHEVSPNFRFFRATQAVRAVGFLDGMIVGDKVEAYQRAICAEAGLFCHWDFDEPWLDKELLDLTAVTWDENFVASNDVDIYLQSLQKAYWRYRRDFPGATFVPCHYEYLDPQHSVDVFMKYMFMENRYLLPLVISGKEGIMTYMNDTEEAANWFMLRAAQNYAMKSIFLETGPIELASAFPVDLAVADNFRRNLVANIEDKFPGLIFSVS